VGEPVAVLCLTPMFRNNLVGGIQLVAVGRSSIRVVEDVLVGTGSCCFRVFSVLFCSLRCSFETRHRENELWVQAFKNSEYIFLQQPPCRAAENVIGKARRSSPGFFGNTRLLPQTKTSKHSSNTDNQNLRPPETTPLHLHRRHDKKNNPQGQVVGSGE